MEKKEKTIDGMTENDLVDMIINCEDAKNEFKKNFIPNLLAISVFEVKKSNVRYDRNDDLVTIEDVDEASSIAEKAWICIAKSAAKEKFKQENSKD